MLKVWKIQLHYFKQFILIKKPGQKMDIPR